MYSCPPANWHPVIVCVPRIHGHLITMHHHQTHETTHVHQETLETLHQTMIGSQLIPNVSILSKLHDKQDLMRIEALLIKQPKPIINIQANDFNQAKKIF